MRTRTHYLLLPLIALLSLSGCGDGEGVIFASFNGGAAGSDGNPGLTAGFVFVSVTDAKPMLPSGTEEVWITFEEVLIHREGGDWTNLPLVQTDYTIDLLRFHSGKTTDLIQPAILEPGSYERMRISISSALIVSNGEFHSVVISSDNLTIEEGFSFDLEEGGSADITIDLDLSQSLREAALSHGVSYELTPVFHVNHTQEAAIIHGQIAAATFDDCGVDKAIVTLIMDKDFSGDYSAGDEEFTRVIVTRGSSDDPTEFHIFWLAPQKDYLIQIEVDGDQEPEHDEFVFTADLQPGDIHHLNKGIPI